jgi:hypothetical protein
MPAVFFPLLVLGSFVCLVGGGAFWVMGGWDTYAVYIRLLLAAGLCIPLVACVAGAALHAIDRLRIRRTPEQRLLSTAPELRISAGHVPAQGWGMLWRALAAHVLVLAVAAGLLAGHHALSQGGVSTLLAGIGAAAAWGWIVLPTLQRTWYLVRHPLDPSWAGCIDRCVCTASAALLAQAPAHLRGGAKLEIEWTWTPEGYTAQRGDVLMGLSGLLTHRTPKPHPGLFLPRASVAPMATEGQWRALGLLWPFLYVRSRDMDLTSAHTRMGYIQALWAQAGAPALPSIGVDDPIPTPQPL